MFFSSVSEGSGLVQLLNIADFTATVARPKAALLAVSKNTSAYSRSVIHSAVPCPSPMHQSNSANTDYGVQVNSIYGGAEPEA